MKYNIFIQNIINTRGQFSIPKGIYYERPYIIPKCKGGINDKSNLIDLFPQEHFIAHKLLAEENPNDIKLVQAYACMAFTSSGQEQRYEFTPKAREKFSRTIKEYYKDKTKHPCYGTHLDEERKKTVSDINCGNKYCVERKLSAKTREKISVVNKNPSKEIREKVNKAQKARNLNGGNGPKAKKVIRLKDSKIYFYAEEAALENNINYSTFKQQVRNNKNGFIYYEAYLNLEKQ